MTNKNQHTDGPWEFYDEQNSNGYTIFRFHNFSGSFQQWSGDANKHANAKLISAAPELLDAVQKTMAFFDDMPKGQFGKIVCDVGLMNDMFIAISNAIKKATE